MKIQQIRVEVRQVIVECVQYDQSGGGKEPLRTEVLLEDFLTELQDRIKALEARI